MDFTNSMDVSNLNPFMLLSGVEVGKHLYWEIQGITIHGQVFLVSWFVIAILVIFSLLGTTNIKRIPESWQNFMESVVEFIKDTCKDALTKNKFCQFTFIKYFEGSSETCTKVLDLMKSLVKKQILFKSNLSRGLLLIHSNWHDLSLDFSTPGKKMRELLLFLKNMGITKSLESLLKEYKIEFVESI
jgi:hypothetical protein